MSAKPPSTTALRVADLPTKSATAFALRPDRETLDAIARELDLSGVRKLSFEGEITALGRSDWQLRGTLGATVVQPCVVTLEPVTTRIDTDVTRQFVADFQEPDDPEVEMVDDTTTEPLGPWIDPAAVMIEALALAAPDYPRKDDAELGQMVYTKPGDAPMTDDDAKPFAGLAGLKSALDKDDS